MKWPSAVCKEPDPASYWQLNSFCKYTGSGMKILLFDTGIRINKSHCSFKSRKLGENLIFLCDDEDGNHPFDEKDGKNPFDDKDGHGTLCAGIACGDRFDDIIDGKPIKCRGVAPEAKLLIWKAYEKANNDIDVDSWALELKKMAKVCKDVAPDVVVIPCGTLSNNMHIQEAIISLHKQKIIVVCSVGNYGKTKPKITYPAGYDQTIAVGAHNRLGHECDFSSVEGSGKNIFLALGEDVVGPDLKMSLTRDTGTSFAAPAVGGLICLLLQAFLAACEACEPPKERRKMMLLYHNKIKSGHVMKLILQKLSNEHKTFYPQQLEKCFDDPKAFIYGLKTDNDI